MNEMGLRSCSACGKQVPREDMFGAEPDLLCESCAQGLRERLTPKATGRLASTFGGRPTPATVAVLAISAVLYVVFHFWLPTVDQLPAWLTWLGQLPPRGPTGSIATGEWWRLVTTAFLHGNLLHILFNSMWIWGLGRAVEGTRGTLAFVVIFVGSAMFSAAAQWYFQGGGIGLSGVLYGLAGYLWMRRKQDPIAAAVMNPSNSRVLGIWLVICIAIPALNVANWAHGGGLAWGLAAGWASTQKKPLPYYVALIAVTLAAAAWVSTGHRIR